MQCISVFLDIAKFPDSEWVQEVCHVIHIIFGSPLAKV